MDNPRVITPMVAKLKALKRVHNAVTDYPPKFVICNHFTARELSREAQHLGLLVGSASRVVVDGIDLVVHPQDNTQQLVMEVM